MDPAHGFGRVPTDAWVVRKGALAPSVMERVEAMLHAINQQPEVLQALGINGVRLLSRPSSNRTNIPPELREFYDYISLVPGMNTTLRCQSDAYRESMMCRPTAPVGCNNFKSIRNGTFTLWSAAGRMHAPSPLPLLLLSALTAAFLTVKGGALWAAAST